MKTFLIFFVAFFTISTAYPQTPAPKSDVVLKMNGEELEGTITEMNDADIRFTYKGEKLQYTIKKQDIQRITFASGRLEVINTQKGTQTETATTVDSHNKAAILPFGLVVDNQGGSEDMAYTIQTTCYNLLSKKAATIQYQDPSTTNAILLQKGITRDNFRAHTMDELCHILGVEFVVQGTVTITKGAQVASTTGNTTIKAKPIDPNKPVLVDPTGRTPVYNRGGTSKATTTQTSTLTQKYQTNVLLNIFDEHGSKIYGVNRESFWPDPDAYKNTLEFLAKRAPLYGR